MKTDIGMSPRRSHKWTTSSEKTSLGICRQKQHMQTENSKNCVHICTTVCTSAQFDQALHCLPAKLLDIVERKGPDEIAGTDSEL